MTPEKKKNLIKFWWNLVSSIIAAIGTALGVSSCF